MPPRAAKLHQIIREYRRATTEAIRRLIELEQQELDILVRLLDELDVGRTTSDPTS